MPNQFNQLSSVNLPVGMTLTPVMGGITLRDFFAAKAMTVYLLNYSYEAASLLAYDAADAMLKAREAK